MPPRRRGQRLWQWGEKLYIPVRLALKNRFRSLAREHRMSQAELGLILVEAAMRDREWFERVISHHKERGS